MYVKHQMWLAIFVNARVKKKFEQLSDTYASQFNE